MEEIWKTIEDYPNYMVSNMGRVKRIASYDSSKHYRKEKFLSLKTTKDGYYEYTLCKDGKLKSFKVHRLVCETFLSNPENKPYVDHINTNRTDNRVENLRWVTQKENCNNPNSKNNYVLAGSIPVLQFSKDGSFIKKWNSAKEASIIGGFNSQHISKCCLGRYGCKTSGGYIWKFAS